MASEVKSVFIRPQSNDVEPDDLGNSMAWYSLFYPIDVVADESNEITMAPLESGIRHFDGKVFNPTKIEIVGYVTADKVEDFKSRVEAGLNEMEFDKCLWIAGTKSDTFPDLIMTGLKESDEKDMFDNVKFTVSFVQAIIDTDPTRKNNKGNSNTVDVGLMGSR